MYVRWKRRKIKGVNISRHLDRTVLSAVLVKAERVDGKVRQRFVAHLGCIRVYGLSAPEMWGHRVGFWRDANKALDALGLDAAERECVAAKLAETVRPLTSEEQAELARNLRAREERIRARDEGLRQRWKAWGARLVVP